MTCKLNLQPAVYTLYIINKGGVFGSAVSYKGLRSCILAFGVLSPAVAYLHTLLHFLLSYFKTLSVGLKGV